MATKSHSPERAGNSFHALGTPGHTAHAYIATIICVQSLLLYSLEDSPLALIYQGKRRRFFGGDGGNVFASSEAVKLVNP